ncbi:MAG: transcriptional regulator FilR1 domain-containing protein [Candidatus Bathyarchaeia archaeon]
MEGKVDNTIRLLLQGPKAHKWAEELFLYYWDRAEKLPYEFTPPTQKSGFPSSQRQH